MMHFVSLKPIMGFLCSVQVSCHEVPLVLLARFLWGKVLNRAEAPNFKVYWCIINSYYMYEKTNVVDTS